MSMEMKSTGVVDLRRDFRRTVSIIDVNRRQIHSHLHIYAHVSYLCDLILRRGRIYFSTNLSQAREERKLHSLVQLSELMKHDACSSKTNRLVDPQLRPQCSDRFAANVFLQDFFRLTCLLMSLDVI